MLTGHQVELLVLGCEEYFPDLFQREESSYREEVDLCKQTSLCVPSAGKLLHLRQWQ